MFCDRMCLCTRRLSVVREVDQGLHQGAGFVDAASAAFSLARAPARVLARP